MKSDRHPCWRMPSLAFAMIAVAGPAQADPTLITPAPREIKLTGEAVDVVDGLILLTEDRPTLRVAAGEINQRLKHELRAKPLPVKVGGLEAMGASAGPVFAIGVSGSKAMAGIERGHAVDVPDRAQGYGIAAYHRGGRLVLILAGHDEQGALYAAVTVRHLLDPAGGARLPNGRAAVRPATVRDWPDFPWRQIGRPPTTVGTGWELNRSSQRKGRGIEVAGARFVAEGKQYVDFLLRHKVNLSWTPAVHLETGGDGQYRYIRELADYARVRGIGFVEKTHSHIGLYPQDKDDPRKSRCVDHRTHKRYFCWSLLDIHEARARHLARAMKASGTHWLYLHATDGGGWEDPARWSERCEECRRIYGDDHAKADAAVFGTWYRVMKQEIPDFRMIAVVYPYTANAIDPASIATRLTERSGAIPNVTDLAREIADRNRRFLARVGRLLPSDVFVCQREVRREQYALMTACYDKRGFQIYLEQKHGRGWNPEFTIASGWAKTFFRPGFQDVFYPSDCSWGHNYLSEMMSAQFGWNVESPGARDYTNPSLRSTDIDHHIEPRDVSRAYVERFCRDFYGPEIGPHMVAVYDTNISYRFIQRPAEIIAQMGIDEPDRRMEQTVAAVARAWQSLGKARETYDAARAAGRNPIPDPLAAAMFGEMFRAVLVCHYVAPYQLRMLQARKAAITGDMDKAKHLIARMRKILAEGKSAWSKLWPWMKTVPILRRRNPRFVYTFGQFQNYDFTALADEATRFEGQMHKLYEAYNVPRWFRAALRERTLYAVPAGGTVAVDGRLSEPAWKSAPPNEYFVNHKTSTPAERSTEVRVVYDRTGVYMGYSVREPNAHRIPINPRARDDRQWNPEHSVELFVDANGDRETYTHYIWGLDGSLLDGRRRRDAKGVLRSDEVGFTSKTRFAVARDAKGWTLEAWVPAEELGAAPRPGGSWRANFCRNLVRSDDKRESVSTVLLDGDGFHTPAKFAELRFLAVAPPPRRPTVRFDVHARKAAPCTIGDGTGYELEVDVSVDTSKPLHAASLVAEMHSGSERAGTVTLFEGRDVELLWRSRKPMRHIVRTPAHGVYVDFRLTADEGRWTIHRRFGSPRPRTFPARFITGVSGKALDGCAHFSPMAGGERLFDSRQGTLEMWVKAPGRRDQVLLFGPRLQHVFFSQSPVRYEHPLLDNTRSVCLRLVGNRLLGRVSTRQYQQLAASTSAIRWDQPGWHHVAMQWSAADGKSLAIQIYLDGRLTSRKIRTELHDREWRKRPEPLIVQLGSMVTGAGPLGWPIDEVRVSSAPRYSRDFQPPRRPTCDGPATVVFHFDGDLTGEVRGGSTVTGKAGPGL